MAERKKFYWLKLKDDFFNQKEIKKLRRIAGGDTYTIIYLKMQLLSLKNEGKLMFEGVEDDFIQELSLELDEEVENIRLTYMYLKSHNMIEEVTSEIYILPKALECIGKESDSAERVRRFRENHNMGKTLQSNAQVTNSNTEIEIEIDKEIDKRDKSKEKRVKKKLIKKTYSERVLLTEEEYMQLIEKYGNEEELKKGIGILNNYIQSKEPGYKSHYHVLIGWVLERVMENAKSKGIHATTFGTNRTAEEEKPRVSRFPSKNYLAVSDV